MKRDGYRLFKTSYVAAGVKREAKRWYVEFRQNGRVRRLPAFTDRRASDAMGRSLAQLVSYHRATGGQTDPALGDWLQTLPPRTRTRLVEYGLLPREREAAAKALEGHLADWAAALTAKGNTARHVDLVTGRAKRVFKGCGFTYYADIDGGDVLRYLDGLRQGTKERRGISAQTFNFHLSAVKGFCRWMLRNRRATANPVIHLDPLNVKTDRRRDRRALTVTETRALLDTTRHGPERDGMSGEARATLYRLMLETGLRAGEARSLTRAAFKLDAKGPTVTVPAAYSKHRREDVLPLRVETAAALKEFMSGLAPAAQVFKLPVTRRIAATMFRSDVEAAGIAYVDDEGRYADMHSLRHTFISSLANGGVHPKVAQTLARHCTVTLTLDRYSHVLAEDQTAALGVLPDLSAAACAEAAKANGTDGKNLARYLALSSGSGRTSVDSGGRSGDNAGRSQVTANAAETANFPQKTALGRGAGAAYPAGLENR